MPITLLVRSGESQAAGREAPSLTFDGTQRVVIGRGPGCDLRLPDTSVSQRHASVQAKGADYFVVDEGSTNGTFIGGIRLSPHAPRLVRTGELVRVGRVWLEVRIDAGPITRDLANATRDLALALVARAMAAQGEDTTTTVKVVEGRDVGAVLRLADEGRVYVVGRAEECDLPIADADASRAHLQIVRRGASVLVRDLGAKNGSWLGEAPLPSDRDLVWRPATMVKIGRTVLALEEPVAEALQELEDSEEDVLPEGPPPASPPPTLPSMAAAAPLAEPEPEPHPSPPPPPPPSSTSSTGSAPIASPPVVSPAASSSARRLSRWTVSDILVLLAAVSILGLSVAGLVWLLRT